MFLFAFYALNRDSDPRVHQVAPGEQRIPFPPRSWWGQILGWLWASPYTLLGLLMGLVALVQGGKVRVRWPTIEFYGGSLPRELGAMRRCGPRGAAAMTFGHVIVGVSASALDHCRRHELVHVRQAEYWGPLFGPAYVICSVYIWLRGGDAYRDNSFEREAYRIAP